MSNVPSLGADIQNIFTFWDHQLNMKVAHE
jgi:hypothetical protein